jgi:hypothetical protein
MRYLIILLLLFSTVCHGQLLNNQAMGQTSSGSEEGTPPPPADETEYNPTLTATTYAVTAGGDEYYAIFIPARYYSSTASGEFFKTVYYYNGDGGDGDPTQVNNQNLSGSGVGPYTGNFTNGARDVFWGTVVIEVSDVEVGRGQWNETILGDGVTGTFDANGSNGAISVTFDVTPGATPTVSYLYSPTTEAGLSKYIAEGDTLDGSTIVVLVHKAANDSYYDLEDHFDDVVADVEGTYRSDPNRRIVAGLSRGAFMARDLVEGRYTDIAGALMVANSSSGATIPWANLFDKGLMWICGQNDGVAVQPLTSYLNTIGGTHTTMRMYPSFTYYNGVGHSATLWNTSCFNRSTAPFDWCKWASLWNLDVEDQADQMTTAAEESEDIDDYRLALRATNYLSAGAEKTALLGRLATLKTTIDGGHKRWYVDAGATTDATSGINNAADFDTGVSYTNINDDNGNSSTVDFAIVAEMNTTGTDRVTTNARTSVPGFGFSRDNYNDYSTIGTATTTGQVKWYGLDNAKTYKVVLYCMAGTATGSNDVNVRATIGGVSNTIYTMYTNTRKIEFTGIAPSSNQIVIGITAGTSDATSGVQVYMLEEEN